MELRTRYEDTPRQTPAEIKGLDAAVILLNPSISQDDPFIPNPARDSLAVEILQQRNGVLP